MLASVFGGHTSRDLFGQAGSLLNHIVTLLDRTLNGGIRVPPNGWFESWLARVSMAGAAE